MRILQLSNFYPPHSFGGYEQWCEEVTERLRGSGHTVTVLTSRFRHKGVADADEPWVHRNLKLEMEFASLSNAVRFFTDRAGDERANLACVSDTIATVRPDCIVIWGMWNIHRSVAACAERLLPGRVVYYVGDYWPSLPSQYEPYWTSPAQSWVSAVVKAPLRTLALRTLRREGRPQLSFQHALFPTAFVRDELARRQVRAANSQIVFGGVDTAPYTESRVERPRQPGVVRLLWVGRLAAEKGPEVAIRALNHLRHGPHQVEAQLTIAGSGDAAYEQHLHRLVAAESVTDRVQFVGNQSKAELVQLYRNADVFLFTSLWPEPFGRTVIEAMASGLPVVGTPTGGAAELLVDRENALCAGAGDAATRALLTAINARKRVFLTSVPTSRGLAIRVCVLSFRTHAARIDAFAADLAAALATG